MWARRGASDRTLKSYKENFPHRPCLPSLKAVRRFRFREKEGEILKSSSPAQILPPSPNSEQLPLARHLSFATFAIHSSFARVSTAAQSFHLQPKCDVISFKISTVVVVVCIVLAFDLHLFIDELTLAAFFYLQCLWVCTGHLFASSRPIYYLDAAVEKEQKPYIYTTDELHYVTVLAT
ncbi:hypothetical protein ACLOJK_018596 [Asimina triloba]